MIILTILFIVWFIFLIINILNTNKKNVLLKSNYFGKVILGVFYMIMLYIMPFLIIILLNFVLKEYLSNADAYAYSFWVVFIYLILFIIRFIFSIVCALIIYFCINNLYQVLKKYCMPIFLVSIFTDYIIYTLCIPNIQLLSFMDVDVILYILLFSFSIVLFPYFLIFLICEFINKTSKK